MERESNPSAEKIKLVECPRDAMQGWPHFIPTEKKISYINALLKVGFDTIDAGSFVSPKAIPQMADTADVFRGLKLENTHTKLLAIVANERGAQDAVMFDELSYLGFPFSVSETFQQRNTNSGIKESLLRVENILDLCFKSRKELVVYMSMGFGNPYGDEYSEEALHSWITKIAGTGVEIISLADTVGIATPAEVFSTTKRVINAFPKLETGVHLHSTNENWYQKLDAAYEAGCRRFDGALKGIGGCPMADDVLVGNMDSEKMIPYFTNKGLLQQLDTDQLRECTRIAAEIFA